MIKKIILENFQSHKDSILEFHPGVNSIIGSSNQGKTSILRGLYWTVYNRPSALRLISHWNRDKNGNPINDTKVTLENDKAIISRIKNKELNGYEINNKSLEAIGMDIPEEIQSAFNLEEVNIQKQMDAPFLLSETAGEVARFFNRIIRLDLIDKVLSNAESLRRSLNKDIANNEKREKELDKAIEELAWIEEAEILSSKWQELENKKTQIITKKEKLDSDIEEINSKNKILDQIFDVKKVEEKISEIEGFILKQNKVKDKINNLEAGIGDYNNKLTVLNNLFDNKKAEEYYQKIESLLSNKEKQTKLYNKLFIDIEDIKDNENKISSLDKAIKDLILLIPDICPLCGNQIKKEEI